MMSYVFIVASLLVIGLSVPYLYRVIVGPSVFDRVIALNAIGTKVPVLLVFAGVIYDRVDMFVDLALALFLLNLFMTLLVAKFVREQEAEA